MQVLSNFANLVSIWLICQVPWQGPKWELAVACGSLQSGRADWLVEKGTELGAWSLRPVLTERSPGIGALPLALQTHLPEASY